jgi:oligoendopeptidase F
MPRHTCGRFAAPLAFALLAAPAAAKERARSDVPEKYRWDLTDLYATERAWREDREQVARGVEQLARHRGTLGQSAGALRAALDAMFGLEQRLQRLAVYAHALSDEDTRVAGPRELRQSAQQLAVELDAASSFVRPELLALDPARIRSFLAEERGLDRYRFYLEDVLRWQPHTLSGPEERVVAEAGSLTDAGDSAYGILKDADLPYPTVTLSTGEAVRLDASAFMFHRASTVREDRDLAFEGYLGALAGFQRTMGTTLYAAVRAHLFTRKVRRFESALAAALFRGNIPVGVYRQLVHDVRRSLPTFHRYLALRRRMLGLEVLRYQDLYVPLVAEADMTFGPDEAREVTLDALAPLGEAYVATLRRGFESRWTDYLPSTGKRSGAYSTGVYGVHPYQLLNFNGRYDDVSTLAHESGHSMHTWLANQAQPYPTADYPIFVAEVASTLNENLLLHEMLRRARDDATRLQLLGSYLDSLRGTLFRQTQFAEFELAIHEQAERGGTLTGENLSELYLRLVREYHGHDAGVCQVPDRIAVEWAAIPHFYMNFYVYQYATSVVAATSLAQAIRDEAARGETRRRDAYLDMLRAGGSRYAIDLLRAAGVDMTSSAPFDAAMAEMNRVMDEMERIVEMRGAR